MDLSKGGGRLPHGSATDLYYQIDLLVLVWTGRFCSSLDEVQMRAHICTYRPMMVEFRQVLSNKW